MCRRARWWRPSFQIRNYELRIRKNENGCSVRLPQRRNSNSFHSALRQRTLQPARIQTIARTSKHFASKQPTTAAKLLDRRRHACRYSLAADPFGLGSGQAPPPLQTQIRRDNRKVLWQAWGVE